MIESVVGRPPGPTQVVREGGLHLTVTEAVRRLPDQVVLGLETVRRQIAVSRLSGRVSRDARAPATVPGIVPGGGIISCARGVGEIETSANGRST